MSEILITLAVLAANLLGAAMAVPQAARLLRTRRVDGVSPAWAAMGATGNAWWALYGLGVGNRAILPVSVIATVCYLVIAIALVRHRTLPLGAIVPRMALAVATLGTLPLVALVAGGWTAVGLVLGALYAVQLAPAVVTVYRSADVSGVSAATWAIAWVEAALWGVYGLPRADVGLVVLAVTGTVMAGLVLARLFVRRPRPSGDLALSPA